MVSPFRNNAENDKEKFDWLEYLVFSITLAFSLGIGMYYAFAQRVKARKATELLLTKKGEISVLPMSLSIMASFLSAVTLIGTPAEMYTYGTEYWTGVIGIPIAGFLAAVFFIPVFFKLRLTSIYEYLELRFQSLRLRRLGTFLFIVRSLISSALSMYAPAVAISAVTNISEPIAILISFAICTFSASLGGIRAVVWTDTLQAILMYGGVIAIIVQGSINVGGLSEVWRISKERGRINSFDWSLDPRNRHTVLTAVSYAALAWLSVFGVSQVTIQRYCCLDSMKSILWTVFLAVFAVVSMVSLSCLAGLAIFATYADCDPVEAGVIEKNDYLVTHFALEQLGYLRGVPGLFVAALFSGSISTASSQLNSLAAVTWEDLVLPTKWGQNLGKRDALWWTKALGVSYGILSVSGSFLVSLLSTSILQITQTLLAILQGPMLGLFTAAVFLPFANAKGAATGLIVGTCTATWIAFGGFFVDTPETEKLPVVAPPGCNTASRIFAENVTMLTGRNEEESETAEWLVDLYSISYMLFIHVGFFVTVLVSATVSVFTGGLKSSGSLTVGLDPSHFGADEDRPIVEDETDLMHPWVNRLLNRGSKRFM